jgi:hypothetical protein
MELSPNRGTQIDEIDLTGSPNFDVLPQSTPQVTPRDGTVKLASGSNRRDSIDPEFERIKKVAEAAQKKQFEEREKVKESAANESREKEEARKKKAQRSLKN